MGVDPGGEGRVVRTAVVFEAATGPARIGVVLFDEDVTSEDDLASLRGDRGDLAVHVARMPLPLDHSPTGLTRAAEDLAAAAATLAPSAHLRAVCYSCTTGALELGLAGVAEALGRGRPDTPVATPISGAVGALKALGVSRIALVTPYNDALTGLIVNHLASQGIGGAKRSCWQAWRRVDLAAFSQL